MCHPAVALAISLAATAAQTYAGVQQQKAQAKAAQAAADYNSQAAANEAATRQQLAQREMEAAAEQRDRVARAGLAHQGEMKSKMGASGFTLDQGTNLSLLGQSAAEVQQDADKVRQQGQMAAWQHLAAITGLNNQSAYGQWEAANTKAQSKLAQTGTILGGVASAAASVAGFAGAGGFGSGAGGAGSSGGGIMGVPDFGSGLNLNQALNKPAKNYSYNPYGF